ncbi:hypothetical protein [Micromonospora arida]|uniref:hypothetical protein n=1 Tax=Micromonospora arida TaxID=2203715 RepID=UPI0033AD75B8
MADTTQRIVGCDLGKQVILGDQTRPERSIEHRECVESLNGASQVDRTPGRRHTRQTVDEDRPSG